jgi:hypothetical protein
MVYPILIFQKDLKSAEKMESNDIYNKKKFLKNFEGQKCQRQGNVSITCTLNRVMVIKCLIYHIFQHNPKNKC